MLRYIIVIMSMICTVSLISARSIQGVVFSSIDSIAVVGAKAQLFSNGLLLSESLTDSKGSFTLESNKKNNLKLEISHRGYATTRIIIESGLKNSDLGIIYLDKASELSEVTVTADPIINSKGRTIVFPSGSDVASSATSISLFQKLPLAGLMANPISRTLTVDGGIPVILINGVPSTIDEVRALQPKDIEKIEYSCFTPGRYANSGNNGYINITLKKRNDGGNIYLYGRTALTTAFIDGNIRASYHQGPSEIAIQYSPSWRNYQKVYDNSFMSYIGDDFRVNLEEHDRNPFYYHTHAMSVKYNYSPSLKTLFTATFNACPSYNKKTFFTQTSDSELGDYYNESLSKGKSFTPSLDLFFRHDFNDNNSLEAQVVGTLNSDDYFRENKYFIDNDETIYSVDVNSHRRSLISEIHYTHDFSDKTSLSAGYQNTASHSTNHYRLDDYKPILTENNNYLFVSFEQRIGKVFLNLSTGEKLFWINNDVYKRKYFRNLTSALFSWNINRKWNVMGSFRYMPSIPSLTSLTDYAQQTTPYLITNGNPNLKAPVTFNYSISASYSIQKFQAYFRSSFTDFKNSFTSDVEYVGNKMFLSHEINGRYSRTFYNSLSLRLSNLYGFGANISLSLSHYQAAGANWSHKLTSFGANFYLWWNKGPFTISYWRKIPEKYLIGHMVRKEENGDQIQVDWRPNQHWNIGLSWMYMFDKKGTKYPSWDYSDVNPSHKERYIENNGNMVVLSVTYTADFGSLFHTAKRNLKNIDNSSSILKI